MKYILLFFPNLSQQAPKSIVMLMLNKVTATLYVSVNENVCFDLKCKPFVSSTLSYTNLEEQLFVDSNEWSAWYLICCHLFEVPSNLVSMHCHCKIFQFKYLYTSVA